MVGSEINQPGSAGSILGDEAISEGGEYIKVVRQQAKLTCKVAVVPGGLFENRVELVALDTDMVAQQVAHAVESVAGFTGSEVMGTDSGQRLFELDMLGG